MNLTIYSLIDSHYNLENKQLFLSLVNGAIFHSRWGNRPIDEAQTFGHSQVVEYLNNFAIAHKTEQMKNENEHPDNKSNNSNNNNKTSENEEDSSAASAKDPEKINQPPLP